MAKDFSPPIINTGENFLQPKWTLEISNTAYNDIFDPTNTFHVLETDLDPIQPPKQMDTEAFIRKLELQYFDTLEDAKSTDWAYIPSQVLSHRVACVPRKQIIKEGKETKVKVSKEKHLRVKTVWKNGEISWVAEDSLRKQNPWVLLNYIRQYSLQNHPSFSWSKQYLKNKSVITNLTKSLTFSTKSQTGPKFKFGV